MGVTFHAKHRADERTERPFITVYLVFL